MSREARFGRWEVQRLLGRGGMAEVWLAVDPDGRPAAIKQLLTDHEPLVRRFVREREALDSIDHPGVIRALDAGVGGGRPWLALTWVNGPDLRQHAERLRRRPPSERVAAVRRVALDLLDALAAVHRAGWVHRDLKPQNVLLDAGRDARLIDFGVVAPIGVPDEHRVTASGVLVGTAAWAAPEQLAGEVVDPRADLWGLGATLYLLLTGRRPYDDGDIATVLRARLGTDPLPPSLVDPTVPPELESFVSRLMARDPADRFPDAATAARALDPTAEDDAPLAGREGPLAQAAAAIRRARAGERVRLHLDGGIGSGRTWLARVVSETARRHGVPCVVDPAGPDPPGLVLLSRPAPGAERVPLDPLPVSDVRRSVHLLAPATPDLAAAAERLHRWSGGNPGLLLALVTAHRQGGALVLPETPRVDVGRWLDGLDLDALTVAGALALVRHPLPVDRLEVAAQVPPELVLPELEARGVAARAGRGWRLAAEVLRAPILDRLPDPDGLRARLVDAPPVDPHPPAELDEGRAAWARGEVSLALDRLHAAAALARAEQDDATLIAAADPLADLLLAAGSLAPALGLARSATRLATALGDRSLEVLALLRLGETLLDLGRPLAAARPLADASALAKATHDDPSRRRAHVLRARGFLDQRGPGAEAAALDRLLPWLGGDDPGVHAVACRAQALLGDEAAARRSARRVVRAGSPTAAARQALEVGAACVALGDADSADRVLRAADPFPYFAWRAEVLRRRSRGLAEPPLPAEMGEGLDGDPPGG